MRVRWEKLCMFPQRWTYNKEYIILCPSFAQKGGEGGGQPASGPLWRLAEAPRQRPGKEESRHLTAGRPIWIRLRTESIYGTPVRLCSSSLSINEFETVKPNPILMRERCRSIAVDDNHHTVFGECFHPGERCSLSPKREQRRTQEICIASLFRLHTVPVGQCRSRRRHSSLNSGKLRTWRRTPAGSIERMLRYGVQRQSHGS
jgi:hypothetical protein